MSRDDPHELNELIIPGLTPPLLERGVLWFEKNRHRIKIAALRDGFWKDHVVILERTAHVQISELLRRLDDLGYEKVTSVRQPGEFSLAGGILRIAPIGIEIIADVDFLGNQIETIHARRFVSEKMEKERIRRNLQKRLSNDALKNLKPGDWLVHLDHGIGKFKEKKTIESGEYYILEYAEGDTLWIPVGLEKKLSRYLGFRDPVISRLGSPVWERTKRKVRAGAEKLARELLELYAKREIAKRPSYPRDAELERELAAGFGFEETEDQLLALEDIHHDLSVDTPMDRVLCGDVGFGKTEVALRAAFRVALSGKQVAIITPTTILAWQHYLTFRERIRAFPLRVELLSRIESQTNQKNVTTDLARGKIDIVIGTHRLLSRDVTFAHLGLVIIDEEQRFGVRQKEHFKKIRSEIDILSLSATPIPRTLYLALSGLRGISTIQTPPPGRLPIKTIIAPWDTRDVRSIIEREISRGGQVYVLFNRVATIDLMRKTLEELIPRANIGTIHGKLHEKDLIKTMEEFRNGNIRVLVATTIIENGLDLPNANTLVVRDATRLGLAQAYQIRGRIGRSHVQAHAYFFYSSRRLRGKARDRLKALKEAEELGAGYQLALRDLEIRGAGNVLGKEQSGSINRVGLNLYCQILAEAVETIRQESQNNA